MVVFFESSSLNHCPKSLRASIVSVISRKVKSSIDIRQGLKSEDDFIQSVTYSLQEYPGFLQAYEREESRFFRKYKLNIEDIIYFRGVKMADAADAAKATQSTTSWQEYDGLMEEFIVSLPPVQNSQEEEMEMLVEILSGMELDTDE